MQIRKNTKAFKTILEIVATCQGRPDREKLIRLYITKAGHSIQDRINIEGIQGGDSALFYDMGYDTVLSNLKSSNHQLWMSDEVPGIYFFHSTSNKVWDETPFEFDEAIQKEFSALPELPAVRKKGKTEKVVLPVSKQKPVAPERKTKKAAPARNNSRDKEPPGPDFKLKHKIHFTNLDRVIFRQSKLSKLGVLEYYDKISEYILPHLKDRPLSTRRDVETQKPSIGMNASALFSDDEENVPDWIKRQTIGNGKQKEELLLCNDKEHLLFYVETGCVAFEHSLSKMKTPGVPDYLMIAIDSPEFDISKAIDVALGAKEIFDGLQLRTSIITDGISGLHVYFPLEAKSTFETSSRVAEYLCKLIRIKMPERVSLDGADDAYGKVTLDFSSNASGKSIIAPYSLVPGQSAVVATPILWEEVNEDLHPESFNHETIFKRLKQVGDPLERTGKKVNADDLLERLENHYSFLF
jgi:DNA ligase D-like protein (predicted polymerase)